MNKQQKENLDKLIKTSFLYFRKGLGFTLIAILCFSGFLRFYELNTDCEGFKNYYDFQNAYCEFSGFLNYKITCDIPIGTDVSCNTNFRIFKLDTIKSKGNVPNFPNSDFYFNFSFNNSNFSNNY